MITGLHQPVLKTVPILSPPPPRFPNKADEFGTFTLVKHSAAVELSPTFDT